MSTKIFIPLRGLTEQYVLSIEAERDRLRAVNGLLLAALRGFVGFVEGGYGWATRGNTMETLEILAKEARAAIAEAQKATGTQP